MKKKEKSVEIFAVLYGARESYALLGPFMQIFNHFSCLSEIRTIKMMQNSAKIRKVRFSQCKGSD